MPRFIAFFIFFSLLPSVASAQQDTVLLRFAVAHEELFRKQVSRYYSLSEAMIEQYGEDWDWYGLSSNPNLPWSEALIERYADRWSWFQLQRNPGILWTDSLIRRYQGRIDWLDLCQNPNLPLGKKFFQKYRKEINWYGMYYNPSFLKKERWVRRYRKNLAYPVEPVYRPQPPYPAGQCMKYTPEWLERYQPRDRKPLPEELRAVMDTPMRRISIDLLERYSDYWDWHLLLQCPDLPWSIPFVEKFWQPLLYSSSMYDSPLLFDNIYAKSLNDAVIDTVFQRLFPPGSVCFYGISAGKDRFGLLPDVCTDLGYRDTIIEKYLQFDSLRDSFPEHYFFLGRFFEPPVRFADYHDWGYSRPWRSAAIVVSEKVKDVLERFRLPPHRFYPIQLHLKDDRYGQAQRPYYIFHLQRCDYLYFDYDSLQFFWRQPDDWKKTNQKEPVTTSIRSPDDYRQLEDSIQRSGPPFYSFSPESHRWKAGFDVMPCKSENGLNPVWVSEDVRVALEAAGAAGIKFEKVRLAKPRMLGAETEEHRAQNRLIIAAVQQEYTARGPEPEQPAVTAFLQACARRDSILAQRDVVRKLVDARALPQDTDPVLQRLRAKEIEWEVVLPEKYRQALPLRKFQSWRPEFRGYDFLGMERLSQIGQEWHKTHPFMVRGILIAENGVGDYLAFLLKPDSTYELDDTVYEIWHETGEIKPVGKF